MIRALVALTALAACGPGEPGPGIDATAALAHVRALAAAPRVGDTVESAAAIAYLEAHVEGLARVEVGTVTLPAIDVGGLRVRDAETETTRDPDLVVRFGPPGPGLLVMAHYDTVAFSPGAVDNAAAVATLIELARVLRAHPPAAPVELAFTANEEIGLVGGTALAARSPPPRFAIALDLIGGDGPLSINGAGTLIRAADLRWLAAAAARAGVDLEAPLPHRVMSRWFPQAERSDHGPFTLRGVRAIHLYDRGRGDARIDLAYHQPQDTPDRVDPASIAELGRLLVALAASPPPDADPDADAGFWIAGFVIPRAGLIAAELALLAAALAGLVALRRPRARGGAGLLAGAACYAAAIAAAAGVERLAAGDHPAPWVHAPLRAELSLALIALGGLGLATRVVARRWPWTGDQRYLAAAIALLAAVGGAALAAGGAELAWLALIPAAATALAPRFRPLALAPLVPLVLVLRPAQLREVVANLPLPMLPFAVIVGILAAPLVLSFTWWIRQQSRQPGPLGTLVLSLGCALAMIGGAGLGFSTHPACTAADFGRFHLACELRSEVH